MSRSSAWSFLRALARSKTARAAKPRKGVRFAPALETLEDRATPSTVPHSIARDDWADTDGNNPVTVAVLANDSVASNPGRHCHRHVAQQHSIRQKPARP